MRFISATPTRPRLTPLGQRLLHLSNDKLISLDYPLGNREDSNALWKGVVVREAVRSAWKTVDEGENISEMTDWHSSTAMGLNVIGEEEEDEEYEDEETGLMYTEGIVDRSRGEERWFEELLSTLGEEEFEYRQDDSEWTESSIASPDDFMDLDVDGMEAFTLPTVSTSPPLQPDQIPESPFVYTPLSLPNEILPETEESEGCQVEVVEVLTMDDRFTMKDTEYPFDMALDPYRDRRDTFLESIQLFPRTPIIQALTNSPTFSTSSSSNSPSHSPSPSSCSSPTSSCDLSYSLEDLQLSSELESDSEIDEILHLPPPLYRSNSSYSSCSASGSECDGECKTPESLCEDLEELGWSEGAVGKDLENGLGLILGLCDVL